MKISNNPNIPKWKRYKYRNSITVRFPKKKWRRIREYESLSEFIRHAVDHYLKYLDKRKMEKIKREREKIEEKQRRKKEKEINEK